jgi:glycosyltransferase involved in cell wall biosynthesis
MFDKKITPLPSTRATVVVTTKNRKDELRIALRSAVSQTAEPEILVLDDGSTDGTAEMVRAEFPNVKLHRFEKSKGLIVRRNEGARLATGDIIFSIDDDAEFSTPLVIEQTLRDFSDPRIGAVAIPYIEPHKGNRFLQKSPDHQNVWITDQFVGTAHAVRRDIFLKLGGYREHLVHQGEEGDFCIRLLAEGYFVRLGNADAIIHHESPKRDLTRMDYYGCRNSILFAWQNVPLACLPLHLLATTFNCLLWTFVPHRFLTRLNGILTGYWNCLSVNREPVPIKVYRRWRKLKKREVVKCSHIEISASDHNLKST